MSINVKENKSATNNEEVKKFTIKVTESAEYPRLMTGGVITSFELSEKVTELFSAVYKDFYGCYISPSVNGVNFDIKLYFCAPSVDNGGQTYAFETLGAQNSNGTKKVGILAGLNSLENRNKQQIYNLTDHGREGLIDFFTPNVINNKSNTVGLNKGKTTDISKFVFEVAQNSNINSGIYAVVTGLDINRILAAIYGNKENGEYLQYQLTPIRPLGSTNPTSPTSAIDWILSIQRIGMNELNKLGKKVGMVQTNGIPMVTRQQ